MYLRNHISHFTKIHRICYTNTHIQSLKVWLKSVLPWLKYSIFSKGLFFIGTLCTSTKAETLVKIGSVVVKIFVQIGRFLPYRFKSTNFSHVNCYWTKIHAICTRCRQIIGTIKLLIHIVIF